MILFLFFTELILIFHVLFEKGIDSIELSKRGYIEGYCLESLILIGSAMFGATFN